jgi:hypothetical protein
LSLPGPSRKRASALKRKKKSNSIAHPPDFASVNMSGILTRRTATTRSKAITRAEKRVQKPKMTKSGATISPMYTP